MSFYLKSDHNTNCFSANNHYKLSQNDKIVILAENISNKLLFCHLQLFYNYLHFLKKGAKR